MNHKTLFYILCSVFFLTLANFLFFRAPKDFPTETVVNIKKGINLRSISRGLEKNNIIRSRVVFETLVILWSGEKHLASGDYFFESELPVFEVARRLSKGEHHLAKVVVTVPEGFNVSEIAQAFSLKLGNFDEEKFLLGAQEKEGYLFPDTYFFLTTDTEENVLSSMTENFQKKIMSLRPKILLSGKTEKEIITMASVIEEESKGAIDRKLISGILWRRISIGMPIQVDAYPDTYKTKGLPKNPISNPGLESIEASLHPKDSLYFYYLHDREGNVHYAKSLEEHNLNIKKYLRK